MGRLHAGSLSKDVPIMKKTVIISPFSRPLRNGQRNPKNYPYWAEVIKLLRENCVHVIQVGMDGEDDLRADEYKKNLPMKELYKLVQDSDGWISVDNFFHHMCAWLKKRGVAVWGRSDPAIFGHGLNINLLKSRECLREKQWETWEQDVYRDDVWVSPDTVCLAVFSLF